MIGTTRNFCALLARNHTPELAARVGCAVGSFKMKVVNAAREAIKTNNMCDSHSVPLRPHLFCDYLGLRLCDFSAHERATCPREAHLGYNYFYSSQLLTDWFAPLQKIFASDYRDGRE